MLVPKDTDDLDDVQQRLSLQKTASEDPTNIASVSLVMGCSKVFFFFSLFQHLP